MITSVITILIIYTILLTIAWIWFFKNEKALCRKLYAAGLESFKTEDYKKAKGFFSRIVFLNPNYKDSKYKLGLIYLKLKNYDAAHDLFKQILKNSPKDFDALFNLAQTYQFQEEYNKAEECYLSAINENDKSLDCYFGLGFTNYKQKKYDKALEFFKKAGETVPSNFQIPEFYPFYINKCNDELCSYEENGEGQSIIDNYLKMAKEPNLPREFNISLATAYAKMGNLEQANEYCQKSLLINAEDIESYKLLGVIQLAKKDFVATKNTLSTALHLQPKNKELHDLLSYALCQQVDDCPLQKCREKYNELMEKFLT